LRCTSARSALEAFA